MVPCVCCVLCFAMNGWDKAFLLGKTRLGGREVVMVDDDEFLIKGKRLELGGNAI